MGSFFIEFRDPLFSIIIFFVIIFVIAFFSYWWGRYKKKEDHKHLDKFLRQFNALPSQNELQVLIQKGEMSEKSWLLLANSYSKNGDYEKSIEIYNELLKVSDSSNYRDTMFLLGVTYFKAGFLERAKQVFLNILHKNPRTPQALNYLLLVYEYMRDYKSALDVLEPLEELQKDIRKEKTYLQLLSLFDDTTLSIDEKVKRSLELYKEHNVMTRMVFEYLFRVNPKLAWENFDSSKSELLVDILWRVDKKDLDLDIISQNSYLSELFSARGDMESAKNSSVFELDILLNLNKSVSATVNFEYVCNSCKQIFPFVFNRCSHCHSIDTVRVEMNLTKDYYRDFGEENNSFQ